MKEIWKTYKETKSNNQWGDRVYEVSNYGRVKCNGEIVKPYLHNRYRYYGGFKIATAVASLFISNPDPENKKIVDHIDTNRENDNVTNLRWTTTKENMNNLLTRKHISETHKAEKHPMYGKHHSNDAKQKISYGLKGKPSNTKGKHWKLVDGKRVYF